MATILASDPLGGSKAPSKQHSKKPSSRIIDVLSHEGSFEAPVFIGTSKVPKSISSSESNVKGVAGSVVTEFVGVGREFDPPLFLDGKTERDIWEPGPNISTQTASLSHSSLADAKASANKSSQDLNAFKFGALSCEISRLCCGRDRGQKACLIIFEFGFPTHPGVISGSVSLNFRAKYGEIGIF